MHVLVAQPFKEAAQKYPIHANAIMGVYRQLKRKNYANPEELKQDSPSLDNYKYHDKMYVIDIGGGDLRLLAIIKFNFNKFFVDSILTYSEYDKRWKADATSSKKR
ncbi:MAG: type II toxin-antitoxin system HigB family toxin [Pseudomonadales bacterium]|nr:type II toxin-antitoxin system HigB family toxin [Pseudomonadales bacterium]